MSAFADSVLEPGERVLYEAQFHKKYMLVVELCLVLTFFPLAGTGYYLYMVLGNEQRDTSIIIGSLAASFLLCGIIGLIEMILEYFSMPGECLVTDKRIIIKNSNRIHSCQYIRYVYISLPPSKVVVEQSRFAQYFDAGEIVIYGTIYCTKSLLEHQVKKLEGKHENYVWERDKPPFFSWGLKKYTAAYRFGYVRAPFALKRFLESQTPQA